MRDKSIVGKSRALFRTSPFYSRLLVVAEIRKKKEKGKRGENGYKFRIQDSLNYLYYLGGFLWVLWGN